jgi:hypothetical protein
MNFREVACEDERGSVSYPLTEFGTGNVEPSGSDTRVLVSAS